MPTGVHIRDARRLLFDAAERVLLSAGPGALTSRAVTDAADCAKGVLHRHFNDFDEFLAELVREHLARIRDQAAAVRAAAGTGPVEDLVTAALTRFFDPVTLALVGLIFARDEVRRRVRPDGPGLPLLAEASDLLADYLAEERALGRIAADADTRALAPALIGAGHLLFAGRTGPPPETELARAVAAVLADVLQRRLL